jgi:hypothetical protein
MVPLGSPRKTLRNAVPARICTLRSIFLSAISKKNEWNLGEPRGTYLLHLILLGDLLSSNLFSQNMVFLGSPGNN